MHHKSLKEIRTELLKKQSKRFKTLLENCKECDKLDILSNLAKKRAWWLRKL